MVHEPGGESVSTLYHVSGWSRLSSIQKGDAFTLLPGTQCAEGRGVYFSEGVPRISAAEGARGVPSVIICIEVEASLGWWRSKAAKNKKFRKARTWHSMGKGVHCFVDSIDPSGAVKCSWEWKEV